MQVNQAYLDSMRSASSGVLSNIRELWWQPFLTGVRDSPETAIDELDIFMNQGREGLQQMAYEYASTEVGKTNPQRFRQREIQFLKSNTGKMFERFVGLCIAHYLLINRSEYAIWPFRQDIQDVCNYLRKDQFIVELRLGANVFSTPIDSDLVVFKPTQEDSNIFLLSIKSTLKDRFHNVPFWNLLRICAVNEIHNLSTENRALLSRAKYIAACTDLATEQPDFRGESGPRNLLNLDAALLDGAYVTASRAQGLGEDENHFGKDRTHAFYPLRKFIEMLCD